MITQKGQKATSKIQQIISAGKHSIYIPQKPNKNIRSAFMVKMDQMSSNILPMARVSSMLNRHE